MIVDHFHSREGSLIRISAGQGSQFAKTVAGDFNPIHDADAARFCIPGDLLFALVLRDFGISRRMMLRFRAMVGADVALRYVELGEERVDLLDSTGRVAVEVERRGEVERSPAIIERFIRRYASFSGRNFPEYLEPLLREQAVMFNLERPLVIYDSMAFDLHRLPGPNLTMECSHSHLTVAGRRGEERLEFTVSDDNGPVGTGVKSVMIGGLKPLDDQRLSAFVDAYRQRRQAFEKSSQ